MVQQASGHLRPLPSRAEAEHWLALRFKQFAEKPIAIHVSITEPIAKGGSLKVYVTPHKWSSIIGEDSTGDEWVGFGDMFRGTIYLLSEELSDDTASLLNTLLPIVKAILKEDTVTAVAFLTQLALAHLDFCRHLDGQEEYLLQGAVWRDPPPEPSQRIGRIQRLRDTPPLSVSAFMILLYVLDPFLREEDITVAADFVPNGLLDYSVLPPIKNLTPFEIAVLPHKNLKWSLQDGAVRLLAVDYLRLFESDVSQGEIDWSNRYPDLEDSKASDEQGESVAESARALSSRDKGDQCLSLDSRKRSEPDSICNGVAGCIRGDPTLAPPDEATIRPALNPASIDPVQPTALCPGPTNLGSNVMQRQGAMWHVVFKGSPTFIPNIKGLGYIAYLLGQPRKGCPALDLYEVVNPPKQSRGSTALTRPSRAQLEEQELTTAYDSSPEEADLEGRRIMKQELNAAKRELANATANNDQGREEEAKREVAKLAKLMSGAYGLDGTPRELASPTERARQNVQRSIARAIALIENSDKELGLYLRQTIMTGKTCTYTPSKDLDWQL